MSTYPAVPGNRFAYHLDGTSVTYRNGNGSLVANYGEADMQVFQNESSDRIDHISFNTSGSISFVFPELRNVTGIFYATDEAGTLGQGAEWSGDSADGWGGTWTTVTPTVVGYNSVVPEYRNNINVVNLTNVKAIRIKFPAFVSSNYPFGISAVHIYGSYVADSDRLDFWHPTLDQAIDGTYFDFEDIKRGETVVKPFRLKNVSSTLTASSIVVSASALTVSSPSHVDMHSFSADGTTYTTTVNAGNLAPGAISGVLYDRFITSDVAPTGPWSGTLRAVAGSWA